MNSAKFGHQKLLLFMWVINGQQAISENRQKSGKPLNLQTCMKIEKQVETRLFIEK